MEAEEEERPSVPPQVFLQAILGMGNIAEHLDDNRLGEIAEDVLRDYQTDSESMKPWREKMQSGIDLAKLMKKDKTHPWEGAANVRYPLVTTAALQFNARAYPAIVPSEDVVRAKVWGRDANGAKAARGDRVAAHMSWQFTCQIEEWEEETDKLLTMLPIVGTVIRKVWFDPVEGRPRCRVIPSGAFIVNDAVRMLSEAPRATEELPLFPAEIETRKRSGSFRDIEYVEDDGEDSHKSQMFLEQHCRLDLDDDDYPEPYIVTIHKETKKVARIVADFDAEDVVMSGDKVVQIRRGSYFVPYHFLPSMDGGFHGTGLGLLLGDISETVNTLINMMLDAGQLAALGGGFIGSEFRIKGGSSKMRPGEWRQVAARGGDVRAAMVPMTYPGADATLFQLLGLLIEAGKDVASVKDVLTGETGGRNMTATTTLALIEQGMQVFTAAYKRIFRSLKQEYKLLAKINAATVSPEEYNDFHDEVDQQGQPVMLDPAQDYGAADMDIVPVADPRSVTKMQEAAKAELLMQLASQGLVNPAEAGRRALEAASISNVDELLPQPNPMQQHMEQLGVAGAEADVTLKMVGIEKALAEIQKLKSEAVKNISDAAATEHSARLDEMQTRLEAARDGLSNILRSGLGGMAPAPGQPVYQGGAAGVVPAAGGFGAAGLLGGQPMAGSGTAGPSANAGTF